MNFETGPVRIGPVFFVENCGLEACHQMHIVRTDLLHEVIRQVQLGEFYTASFVYVGRPFEVACIGSTERYWRCSLLGFIREELSPDNRGLFDATFTQIVYGSLEWEAPNEMVIRDNHGNTVSSEIFQAFLKLFDSVSE